ncbi:unnamed protein product [Bemisia tabaci]|uniref:Uncharacterized protein n=1 Tax=Bemisia tabaci TaxID=7038 RepID=A0A9P0F544_BEMTA|nr:unnamed protein product [Bemisia tabaci]
MVIFSKNNGLVRLFNKLNSRNGLIPIITLENPATSEILSKISCKCIEESRGARGFWKEGLHCSLICEYCHGSCENSQYDALLMEEEGDDVDDPEDAECSDNDYDMQ